MDKYYEFYIEFLSSQISKLEKEISLLKELKEDFITKLEARRV